MVNDVTVFNIREYLSAKDEAILGEEALQQILSEFSCEKNSDVETFLKERAIEFTKKNQSITYLVFNNEDAALVGYFTLTIKPISVKADYFSNTVKRKIARVSELDPENGMYTLSAYLIAQLGKNYANCNNEKVSGKQLLEAAVDTIRQLQYMVGGMVIFLEAEDREILLRFYEVENGFKRFGSREIKNSTEHSHTLVQLLKVM